jgi:hypothetical protein
MTDAAFADPTTATIVAFLREIGLDVLSAPFEAPTFLPGIRLVRGAIALDETRLVHPGDILHEAGHLAVATPERRAAITDDAGSDPAEEMMAIGWSYAALVHLRLDPAVVFHADGYRGGGASLIENFSQGRYLGVPMLQWVGMTLDEQHARAAGLQPYPHMLRWLREHS